MSKDDKRSVPFTTVAMAEILLVQDLIQEASTVIDGLEKKHPNDPRVAALRMRMRERMGKGEAIQTPVEPRGLDRLVLNLVDQGIVMEWELTDDSLALAKRKVRYSGVSIVRLFTAAVGPRGVRTTSRDFEVISSVAQLMVSGIPFPAVHTAAIGFLGHSGLFVPMARSPLVVSGK